MADADGISPEIPPEIPPAVTAWLRRRALNGGAHCPCCGQFSKVYNRRITSPMARGLIRQYREVGQNYAHVSLTKNETHEFSQLSWWELIEEDNRVRDDGGRAGWWRITDRGRQFVEDVLRVPKYARIYDGDVIDHEGDQVGIRDALGTRFRYDVLMGWDNADT